MIFQIAFLFKCRLVTKPQTTVQPIQTDHFIRKARRDQHDTIFIKRDPPGIEECIKMYNERKAIGRIKALDIGNRRVAPGLGVRGAK